MVETPSFGLRMFLRFGGGILREDVWTRERSLREFSPFNPLFFDKSGLAKKRETTEGECAFIYIYISMPVYMQETYFLADVQACSSNLAIGITP